MLKTVLALLVLCFTTADAAAAQGANDAAEADRLNAEVIQLFRAGKYDEALPLAKRVVELREKALGGADVKLAYALTNLGNIYRVKGLNRDAAPLFERALAVSEKGGAGETDLAADLQMQLGLIDLDAGRFKEGEPHLRRALAIKEKLYGAESPRVVTALTNLADVNFLRRQTEQAHSFLGRALTILERQPPAKDAEMAKRLNRYYCALAGSDEAENKELSGQLGKVIWKLTEPEKFAEFEKREQERKARAAAGGDEEMLMTRGGVLNGRAVSKPQPSYPDAAKRQGVSGTVVVQITVDETGKVVKAEALCGHPVLARESEDAALRARFTPTLLSGVPVKVSGVITYRFILQ